MSNVSPSIPEVHQKMNTIHHKVLQELGLQVRDPAQQARLWGATLDALSTAHPRGIAQEVLARRMFATAEECEEEGAIAGRLHINAHAVRLQEAKLLEALATLWRIALLAEDRELLRSRVQHLESREAHFAKVLGIPDGGRFRNDWDARLRGALARAEELEREKADLQQRLAVAKDTAVGLLSANRVLLRRDTPRSKIAHRRPL